jgi:hypothetical protein
MKKQLKQLPLIGLISQLINQLIILRLELNKSIRVNSKQFKNIISNCFMEFR